MNESEVRDAARPQGRPIVEMARILVEAGATELSACRAAIVIARGGSYDDAAAELDIPENPVLVSDFEWLSLAHAIETGGDHLLDELIANRFVVMV